MRYVDPDGKEVVVGISTSDTLFGTIFGEHAFIMYTNPDNPTENIMLDASGQFGGGRACDIVESSQIEISVNSYLNYFDTDETLTVFELKLGFSSEEKIKELIENTFGRSSFQCAVRASSLLKDSKLFGENIKKRFTPRGLYNDLMKFAQKNPSIVTMKEYDFITKEEITDEK